MVVSVGSFGGGGPPMVFMVGAGILWIPPCRTAPKKAPAGRWWGGGPTMVGAAVGCCAAAGGLTQVWWVSSREEPTVGGVAAHRPPTHLPWDKTVMDPVREKFASFLKIVNDRIGEDYVLIN